jgi:hypothetical protein
MHAPWESGYAVYLPGDSAESCAVKIFEEDALLFGSHGVWHEESAP